MKSRSENVVTKVVYHHGYGGFSLSGAGEARFLEIAGEPFDRCKIPRHHPALVQVVEELDEGLSIADIPSGSKYRIDEYDGWESVETPESYEWIIAS